MRHFFLVNPHAFGTAALSVLSDRIDLHGRGTERGHSIAFTEFPGEEEEYVRHLVNRYHSRPIRIVICGTLENLHFAVNGLSDVSGIELGFLSCDADHRFFDGFSGRGDWGSNIEFLLSGGTIDVDLLRINDRYCITGAILGFDPHIDAVRSRLFRWRRKLAGFRIPESTFIRLFRWLPLISRTSSQATRICVNGHEIITDQLLYALFANMPSCAEGYPVITGAKADDGLVDMLTVKKSSVSILSALTPYDLFPDEWNSGPSQGNVIHRRCITAEVELPEPTVIAMDGTRYLHDSHFLITVRPATIKMLVPATNETTQTGDSA